MKAQSRPARLLTVALALTLLLLHGRAAAADFSSFAFVHEDGSMTIAGRHVRLYGIYIPPTERTCQTFIRPMPCGTRASLALEFKISGDFVRCIEQSRNADGSITASCSANGDDLSA